MTTETQTNHKPLPMAYIKEHLAICNESPSGLKWITRKRGRTVGPAGGLDPSHGYYKIGLQGTDYRSHRIVYALHTGCDPGDMFIDHRDGDVANNRPDNLRLATKGQNSQNRKTQANNSSGVPGVYWDKHRGKWYAQVKKGGRCVAFKRFEDLAEAATWVATKRLEVFGEFSPESRQDPIEPTPQTPTEPLQLALFG